MSKHNQSANDYVFSEGTSRNQGRSAQRMNILAAKIVGETVRTTLGPQGMDKMIVDTLGDIIITNDGATILKEMHIEHPTAKMIVEVAKTQESEVGDGTTTAVVIAGELLKQAEYLLDQNIHPTVVIKGYRLARTKALEILKNLAVPITAKDTMQLKRLAMTAMTGKVAEHAKEHLSALTVAALQKIEENGVYHIDRVRIEKRLGADIEDTELIDGVVLDKEKAHNAMPDKITGAKIALIDAALEMPQTDTDAKISLSDPSKFQEFLDMEERYLKKLVDTIAKSGANVVFCQKGIDDMVQYLLAQKGIYACRRVKKSDINTLAKATGAHILTNINDVSAAQLGYAGIVETITIGEEDMTFVREARHPKAVSILVRGATDHIADEIRRALDDAIGNVASALKAGHIVAGAGATEIELARQLEDYAKSLSGKEQLAVLAFAKAMEIIPTTLAENAGLDPVDVLTELKAAHDKSKSAGLNVFTGKSLDSFKQGIIEPLSIKTQAVSSAASVAVMILRIDDVIIAAPDNSSNQQPMSPDGM